MESSAYRANFKFSRLSNIFGIYYEGSGCRLVIVRCNRATEIVKRVSVTGVHDIGSQGKFSRSVMSLVRRKYEPCATVKQD